MVDLPRTEKRIVLTGGLSGGHVFPLTAVARAIEVRSSEPVRFLYVGSNGAFEKAAMSEAGIPSKRILSGKVRRYFSLMNLVDPFKAVIGLAQSLWHLFVFMPDAVFAKGGSVSVPVCLAAWIFRIPIVIHDSDAVAGSANRFLARFASRIAVAYPSALSFFPESKTAITGNPVREGLLSGNPDRTDERFGFAKDKPLVLILGGSLGARSLNIAFMRTLTKTLSRAQILHQTGAANHREAIAIAGEAGVKEGREGYVAVPFLQAGELADALARADIVISRAGAGTISELAATGKASILVPLPTAANDEQRMNAFEVAKLGGAIVLEEQNLGEHLLFSKLENLLDDPVFRRDIAEKLRVFHNPEAANILADGILSLT